MKLGTVKVRFLQRIDAGWIVNAGEIRDITPETYAWLLAIKPGCAELASEPVVAASEDPVEARRKDPPGSPPEPDSEAEPEPTIERDKQHRRGRAVNKRKR